ncbi:hypothetical protein SAMN06297358_1632 [Pedobacter xixiisoli]|uniref:Uncharacterized protein n=1 Tax=Pedobacter xixiisoli TaxID=1476464 RepID=A0A285ZY14_9SPHI|nr:hypothetical protein SAMN06297358_1632 [Pedobacter xixiisoli]
MRFFGIVFTLFALIIFFMLNVFKREDDIKE